MLIFSERLRQAMSERGLTQIELAAAVGVSQGAVSGWLNGAVPKMDKLEAIAGVLSVDAEWLISGQTPLDKARTVVRDGGLSPDILKRYANLMTRARHHKDAELERLAEETLNVETAAMSALSEWTERAQRAETKLANLRLKLGEIMESL